MWGELVLGFESGGDGEMDEKRVDERMVVIRRC